VNDPYVLPPEEAAKRFEDDPSSVYFTVDQLMDLVGATRAEIFADLCSGRLIGGTQSGRPDSDFSKVFVRGDDAINWLVTTGRAEAH
jgi:hypothetical protein